ncbi:MAG: radical SAM protein, partial [Methyloceanibacter sp.]
MSVTCGTSATHAPVNVELAPLGLLVVQPTPFCNIDCSYCYLSHRSDTTRMDVATVKAIARFLRGVPLREPQLSVVWHAGEPLTAPIEFYEIAFGALQAEAAPTLFQHHFQTNGMLINDDWCELFKRWSVRIGVSIDGPKEIHDAYRVDRSNRGTYDRVMRGVAKLQEHEIPFTVIGVLTRTALQAPDEF